MKEQIEQIIRKAITRHLVQHVQTTDPRDRIDILCDEAAIEICELIGYIRRTDQVRSNAITDSGRI